MQISSVEVSGRCTMCKTTIEQAAEQLESVKWASWDAESQTLTVKIDSSINSLKDVELLISKKGYDTKHYKASDEAYGNLPDCCKYTRIIH